MAKPTPEETAAAEAAAAAKAAAEEDARVLAEMEAEEKTKAAALEPADQPKALEADEDGMIKVETTGDFMLLDPISGSEIEARGTSNVKLTSFVQQRYELGQLKAA